MNFEAIADKLVEAINSRRTTLGLKHDEPGKLIVATTDAKFDDWINSNPDNSARIALGAKCPLFQHHLLDSLPNDPDATELDIDGTEVGFVVDRLDEDAWNRKRF